MTHSQQSLAEIRSYLIADRKGYVKGYIDYIMPGLLGEEKKYQVDFIDGVIQSAEATRDEGVKEFKHVIKALQKLRKKYVIRNK